MGFLDKLAKAIAETQRQNQQTQRQAPRNSGKLKFQEDGALPNRDSMNRAIVKVQSGKNILLGVNKENATDKAILFLLGKPEAYKEVEAKSVRLRIMRDLESPYPDSVKVETPKGDFVGWIKKNDSALAVKVLDALSEQIRQVATELDSLVFDVGAKVDGTYDEDEDEDGKPSLVPALDWLEVQIKDPAELDVLSQLQ